LRSGSRYLYPDAVQMFVLAERSVCSIDACVFQPLQCCFQLSAGTAVLQQHAEIANRAGVAPSG